ncbi:hypothetical protein [Aphanothece sacrum]|uniref:Uncharacterized protein n=1 Tax=Aphanothece sacrum FPU1 TaxID=1920663 RepID=A0A401IIK3_APHSA|nr:hypothetical protein [Aphanothece sacrum]GBF81142.1 hypothetical protein AsFPU1_2554 [Aphanothece sacrum FPU1]GBF86507.1 hypothetical protein AsFPU3_3578 [Aphanothece sacrum FPU3]
MAEPTYEARMSQMEKLLETSIKLIHGHSIAIDEIREQNRQNVESIARLTQQMGNLTEMFQESVIFIRDIQAEILDIKTEIRDIQTEVRGLQIENRRIIERIFDENED